MPFHHYLTTYNFTRHILGFNYTGSCDSARARNTSYGTDYIQMGCKSIHTQNSFLTLPDYGQSYYHHPTIYVQVRADACVRSAKVMSLFIHRLGLVSFRFAFSFQRKGAVCMKAWFPRGSVGQARGFLCLSFFLERK